jgi:hypothetical protein
MPADTGRCCVLQVPKGLPGYVGNTFFPLVGSTGATLGLAVLVRLMMPAPYGAPYAVHLGR